jgi:3-methylcrotonyl-CoA carboxylase alpha subunit/geranyl-CoA carboxylase alpha subunit
VGAGTVEFLLQGEEFSLMEMNTRLQVEHPVTECVTGLDLVEWQLRVAQGEPLPLEQEQVRFDGHAIEVRLCTEDENFVPHAGRVARFAPPTNVRFDHAIFERQSVPPYYDSMLGKLIAHAPTREEAIDRLVSALDRTVLLGVPNNRRFLAACLKHPEFRAGQALIPVISEHAAQIRALLASEEKALLADACMAAFASQDGDLPCPFVRPLRVRHRGELADLARQPSSVRVERALVAGSTWHLQCETIDFVVDDASFEPAARAFDAAAHTELRAPFNGKVIAVKAQPGAKVARGDTLLVIESMKLEHSLAAARDAVVKAIHVQPGQQAATSQVLVTFDPSASSGQGS